MIVTAEPYFAVRTPSEMVVLENDTRKNTKGEIFPVNDFKADEACPVREAREPSGNERRISSVFHCKFMKRVTP